MPIPMRSAWWHPGSGSRPPESNHRFVNRLRGGYPCDLNLARDSAETDAIGAGWFFVGRSFRVSVTRAKVCREEPDGYLICNHTKVGPYVQFGCQNLRMGLVVFGYA